jgi:long-chain acyl-CoA synthetase
VEDVIRRFAGGRAVTSASSLDELGLSSLDRIQLLMELERRTGAPIDEASFANARTVADLAQARPAATGAVEEPFEYAEWSRTTAARAVRRIALPGLVIPLTRAFAWLSVNGRENLNVVDGPVIFAANHTSHFDAPTILAALPAKWRYRVAPAAAKEFFDAHFHGERFGLSKRFRNSLAYYLGSLVFNLFPLPQREAGVRQALRYAGSLVADGYSILIFPEGRMTLNGEMSQFRPGVGVLAARLGVPVVPVHLAGLDRVLHKGANFATPGRATVTFGAPLRPAGNDAAAIAQQIEDAVRKLAPGKC